MSMSVSRAIENVEQNFHTDEMDPHEFAKKVDYLIYQDHKPWCRTHMAELMPNYGSDCTCGQWLLRDWIIEAWDEGPEAVAHLLNGKIDWKEASMSTRLYITDDGDEVVNFSINEEIIGTVDHGEFGWAGMEKVIKLVEEICETFGIPLTNVQDIV